MFIFLFYFSTFLLRAYHIYIFHPRPIPSPASIFSPPGLPPPPPNTLCPRSSDMCKRGRKAESRTLPGNASPPHTKPPSDRFRSFRPFEENRIFSHSRTEQLPAGTIAIDEMKMNRNSKTTSRDLQPEISRTLDFYCVACCVLSTG